MAPTGAGIDRVVFTSRERAVTEDQNTQAKLINKSTMNIVGWLLRTLSGSGQSGKVAGLQVVPSTGMEVTVSKGLLLAHNSSPDTDDPESEFAVLGAPEDLSIGEAHATLNRIDLICAKPIYVDSDQQTRDIITPSTRVVTPTSVYKRAVSTCSLQVVGGTPHASPSCPSTPEGYIALGEVYVGNGVTEIVEGDITDYKGVLAPIHGESSNGTGSTYPFYGMLMGMGGADNHLPNMRVVKDRGFGEHNSVVQVDNSVTNRDVGLIDVHTETDRFYIWWDADNEVFAFGDPLFAGATRAPQLAEFEAGGPFHTIHKYYEKEAVHPGGGATTQTSATFEDIIPEDDTGKVLFCRANPIQIGGLTPSSYWSNAYQDKDNLRDVVVVFTSPSAIFNGDTVKFVLEIVYKGGVNAVPAD